MRWTDRNNPRRIDVVVSEIVVTFDVIKIHRIGDTIDLIKIAQIPGQIWIIDNPSDVAFEMTMVDGVKADQSHEEPPVCFDW